MIKNLLILVSSIFLVSSHAQAEDVAQPPIKLDGSYKMRITPVAGFNLTTTTTTQATQDALQSANADQSAGPGYSFGLLVGFIFVQNWEIETGLIYSHQRINSSINDTTDNLVGDSYGTFNDLQIPVVGRYEFLPGLSAGGGVYYAHGVGSLSTTSNIAGFSGKFSSTYESSNFKRNDFGLVFNARGSVPISSQMSALFDARYLLGLINLDSTGNPDNASELREVQFLAGLSFEF